MKKHYKMIVPICVIFVLGFAVYVTIGHIGPQETGPGQERLQIQKVEVSSNNTLNVLVQKITDESLTICGAIIKNGTGDVVWATNKLNIPVVTNEPATLKIQYDTLPSESYTLTLVSSIGGSYVAPVFKI